MLLSPKDGDTKLIESQIISFYFKLFEALKDHEAIQDSMNTIKADLISNFFNNSEAKVNDFEKIAKIPVRQFVLMEFCAVLNDQMVEIGYWTVDKAGRGGPVWDVSSLRACWEGLCQLWKNTDIQTIAHTVGKWREEEAAEGSSEQSSCGPPGCVMETLA